ncbi:Uncharacterised protein [Yersinia enterocolitica]|nr:hypothetical protein [Yersinia enterocolitica]CQD56712.1 Uncharacterised protein [Yersinia enterocolitica]
MKAKFSASVKTFYAQNMIDDGSYDIGLPVDLMDWPLYFHTLFIT